MSCRISSGGFIHVDPTLKRALRSPQPFEFTTTTYGEKDGPRVPDIMRLLEDFGFTRGLVIPIHGPEGYDAAVGMVGDKLDLSAAAKPGIHLMALYAYERLRQCGGAHGEHSPSLWARSPRFHRKSGSSLQRRRRRGGDDQGARPVRFRGVDHRRAPAGTGPRLRRSRARGQMRFDPNVRRALRSIHPFEWSESSYSDEDWPRATEIMRFLADFGYLRGFFVPIRGPFGFEAGVWMAGAKLDLTTKTKPSIHLMALYAFERIRQLASTRFEEKSPLTRREREVLACSAQGKSAAEIGEILNVDKRTVDEHPQTAMRKLGAANRTQAVAIAIRRRLFEV